MDGSQCFNQEQKRTQKTVPVLASLFITLRIAHFLKEFFFIVKMENGNALFTEILDKAFLIHSGDLGAVSQRYVLLHIIAKGDGFSGK